MKDTLVAFAVIKLRLQKTDTLKRARIPISERRLDLCDTVQGPCLYLELYFLSCRQNCLAKKFAEYPSGAGKNTESLARVNHCQFTLEEFSCRPFGNVFDDANRLWTLVIGEF